MPNNTPTKRSTMKFLFWLLALINIGLFVYFNLNYILPSAPQIKALEIDPKKIQLLTPQQIEALPRKKDESLPPQSTPVATSCFEWGVFSDTNIANAQSAVAKLALQATIKEQTPQQAKRFWVYREPLKTTQEAQLKAAELREQGIEDLFVVQEPKWKNAISFGVFEDEQLATNLLNELKAKGVEKVVKALRNQGKKHSSLVFSELTEHDAEELKKLKPAFPGAELNEVSCDQRT